MTREEALSRFKEIATRMWAGLDLDKTSITISPDQPRDFAWGWSGGQPIYGAIITQGSKRAQGSHLLKAPFSAMLLLDNTLLTMDNSIIEGVLIHEAAHLGYGNHGQAFREIVRANGGFISGDGVRTGTSSISVQRKVGGRYQTVRDGFSSEAEAISWARAERAKDGCRYRLTLS